MALDGMMETERRHAAASVPASVTAATRRDAALGTWTVMDLAEVAWHCDGAGLARDLARAEAIRALGDPDPALCQTRLVALSRERRGRFIAWTATVEANLAQRRVPV